MLDWVRLYAGVVGDSEASKMNKQARVHGAIQVFGWGVLLPIGAMLARYARDFDPAWFYLHVTFQLTGFVFIVAGVATGIILAKSIQTPGLDGHRGLGLFLFTLTILQVRRPHPLAHVHGTMKVNSIVIK